MSEYNRHKWAMEWMHGGGRDPNGRSLDDEIRIGKEDWLKSQQVTQGARVEMKPGGLVEPGVTHYATKKSSIDNYSRRWHDERARKIKEAQKKGLVYDPTTLEVRETKVDKRKGIPRKVYRESIPQLEPKELPFEPLPKETIKAIKAKFSNVVSEKEWKFDEGRYGIRKKGNERIWDQIRTFVNEPKSFRYWNTLTSPEGWMIAQFDRASLGSIEGSKLYKPIYRTVAGKRRIAGFIDNSKAGGGKKYFASDRWITGKDADGLLLQKSHPDFANTKKFYDIASKAHESPSKVITDILAKGGVDVTDKRLKLNHLLNYLIDEKGIDTVRRAMIIHHKGGVFGSPTRDYQILDKVINKKVQGIELRMRENPKNILKEDIAKLKKWGASVTIDGKTYGGGPKTSIGGERKIQQLILEGSKDVELYGKEIKGIKKWGPKEFNKFRKFIKQNPKLAKQAGIQLSSGLAPIEEIMKMPGMKKALPWIKGELVFAFADMLNNWTKGQSFFKGLGKGVEMATFNLVDFDTDEKALLVHALKKGVPENHIKAMMDYLKYKKEEKKLTGLDTSLAYLDYSGDIGGELSPSHILNPEEGYKYGDRERLTKGIAESEQNLEKLFNEYYAGENKDPTIGLVTLENMMESLTAEEWNKTAGIKGIDRGYREMIGAKADEGMVWGPIFGSSMREFFESIGGEETDSLKAFKPQELMSAHPVYGYKEQIKDMESRGISPMEDIRGHFGYAFGEGGRASYFNGGIASLKKK